MRAFVVSYMNSLSMMPNGGFEPIPTELPLRGEWRLYAGSIGYYYSWEPSLASIR